MNIVKIGIFFLIFLVLYIFPEVHSAYAQQPMPRQSGFAGYLEILGAYTNSNSQLNTDSKNRKTDSLDESGERVSQVRPFPLGLVSYTFACDTMSHS